MANNHNTTSATSVCDTRERNHDYTYTHSPYHHSQAPWTATRCLRLLRPISSKISTLAKLRKNGEYVDDDDLFHDGEKPSKPSTQIAPLRRGELADNAWELNPRPRKRIKRTYSARERYEIARDGPGGHRPGQKLTVDQSQIKISTDTKEHQLSRCANCEASIGGYETCFACLRVFDGPKSRKAYRLYEDVASRFLAEQTHSQQTRTSIFSNTNERMKLCKGLSAGLSALLRATDGSEKRRRDGARSLYSMCLRRVPEFIAEEEVLTRIERPDSDEDVVSDIYAHLEGMAIAESWKPLRTIVRAHGIQLICMAINQNVLSVGMALEMSQTCLQAGALDEAVVLMHEILSAFKCASQALSETARKAEAGQIIDGLLRIAASSGETSHLDQMFPKLIKSTHDIIACEPMLVHSMTRACAQSKVSINSISLLEVLIRASTCCNFDEIAPRISVLRNAASLALKRSLRRHRTVAHHSANGAEIRGSEHNQNMGTESPPVSDSPLSIPAIMTTLCSSFLVRKEISATDNDGWVEEMNGLFGTLAQYGRQTLEIDGCSRSNKRQREAVAIILLVKALLYIISQSSLRDGTCLPMPEVASLVELNLSDTELSYLGSLTYQIAQRCQISGQLGAFDMLSKLLGGSDIQATISSWKQPQRLLWQRLSVSAAFAFTQTSKQTRHLEWALDLEHSLLGKDCVSPDKTTLTTPARPVQKSRIGYRWEDGICEWIAKTPAAVNRKESLPLNKPAETIDELDDTTLVEEWPSRLDDECGIQQSHLDSPKSEVTVVLSVAATSEHRQVMSLVKIPAKDTDREPRVSGRSYSSHIAHGIEPIAMTTVDDDADELCDDWQRTSLPQASVSGFQARSQPIRSGRWTSRHPTRYKSSQVVSRPVGNSLAAFVDHDEQSSDMEDELGV